MLLVWHIFVAAIFFIPLTVLGADTSLATPLVPECDAWHGLCQACDLVVLADNILKFMVVLGVMAVALMLAYAGMLYVTAAGSKQNLDSARKIFWNSFLGLIIILIAFLVTDLFIRTLTNKDLAFWSTIECTSLNTSTGSFEFPPPKPVEVPNPQQPPPYVPGQSSCGPLTQYQPPIAIAPAGGCVARSQSLRNQIPLGPGDIACSPGKLLRRPADVQSAADRILKDEKLMAAIRLCSARHGVSQRTIIAFMVRESSGRRNTNDRGRTFGVMQLGVNDARVRDKAFNGSRYTAGLSREEIIRELKGEGKYGDEFSVCIGAMSIKNLERRYGPNDERRIAAYNTTNGLKKSERCPGLFRFQCPIMSAAELAENGCTNKIPFVGCGPITTGHCAPACVMSCSYVDNVIQVEEYLRGKGL